MSAAPQKFTFDLDLAANSQKKQRLIAEDDFEERIAEARQSGYQEGLSEGESTQVAQSTKQMEIATQQLVQKSTQIVAQMEERHAQMRADAVQLATATAGKLANALVGKFPMETITQLMTECLTSLEGAPHLVIRCNQELADSVKQTAETMIATSGFTGRLIVMGEPDIGLGDARFEWVDGGLVRDMSAISAEIDEKIAEFLNLDQTRTAQSETGEHANG